MRSRPEIAINVGSRREVADRCARASAGQRPEPSQLFSGSAHTTRPPRMKGLGLLSFTDFDRSLLGYAAIRPMLCKMVVPAVMTVFFKGQIYIRVRPGDPPPRTGSPGARSLHQHRPRFGAVGSKLRKMPKEPRVLISTSASAAAPEMRRSERLSLRATIFWIGVPA